MVEVWYDHMTTVVVVPALFVHDEIDQSPDIKKYIDNIDIFIIKLLTHHLCL